MSASKGSSAGEGCPSRPIRVHQGPRPRRYPLPLPDTWVPFIIKKARRYGLEPTFSHSGFFKSMASKSYWSYGKVNHKDGAMIPEGRILIEHCKELRLHRGRAQRRSNGLQAVRAIAEPFLPLYPWHTDLLLRGLRGPEERRSRAFQVRPDPGSREDQKLPGICSCKSRRWPRTWATRSYMAL